MADDGQGEAAFGAPGIPPRWTSSAKDGLGTAYHTAARCWFTLSHGIVNELYYPTIDRPNTRDLQLLITDGESFFHEEKRDLEHTTERLDRDALGYRLTNRDPKGRYSIIKDVITDPHQPVFLMRVRVEVDDDALRDKLRVFVLLAPHLAGRGEENSAATCGLAGQRLIHAWRDDDHLILGARPHFSRRSVGFAGASDGWQDLSDNFRMDWQFGRAERGNLALTAELDWKHDEDGVVVGVGFGDRRSNAACSLIQCLAEPFDGKVDAYIDQWKRVAKWESGTGAADEAKITAVAGDGGRLLQLSRQVILAHEDKTYQGAMVASLSIPWGEARGSAERGGYHLVWPRDMLHSAMALLATGHHGTPRRTLAYLATIQEPDGDMPQNCWIDGRTYWPGEQLDEVAAPLLLAWHLQKHGGCEGLDTWPMLLRGARKIMLTGPVTGQDRWEENSGYCPSTLAALIAALCAVADVAAGHDADAAAFIFDYADWLASHLEDWTVARRSDLVDGQPRHYVRITPARCGGVAPPDAPDTATVTVKNGGGEHPARRVVGGDFLHLVRYGIRPASDPIVRDTLKVIDAVIRHDMPTGPGWQRYNHDGYGQQRDGEPFDGTGLGGCWPLLTGERGVYEVAAGRKAAPYIRAMEAFANAGGMLPEQVWFLDDLPEKGLKKGGPAGSAMPLCWAHAEYLNLCRSAADGQPFDRVDPAFDRYVTDKRRDAAAEIWTRNHPVDRTPAGRPLRLVLDAPATARWTADGWATQHDTDAAEVVPGLWCVEVPGDALREGGALTFTFRRGDVWEGRNFGVQLI